MNNRLLAAAAVAFCAAESTAFADNKPSVPLPDPVWKIPSTLPPGVRSIEYQHAGGKDVRDVVRIIGEEHSKIVLELSCPLNSVAQVMNKEALDENNPNPREIQPNTSAKPPSFSDPNTGMNRMEVEVQGGIGDKRIAGYRCVWIKDGTTASTGATIGTFTVPALAVPKQVTPPIEIPKKPEVKVPEIPHEKIRSSSPEENNSFLKRFMVEAGLGGGFTIVDSARETAPTLNVFARVLMKLLHSGKNSFDAGLGYRGGVILGEPTHSNLTDVNNGNAPIAQCGPDGKQNCVVSKRENAMDHGGEVLVGYHRELLPLDSKRRLTLGADVKGFVSQISSIGVSGVTTSADQLPPNLVPSREAILAQEAVKTSPARVAAGVGAGVNLAYGNRNITVGLDAGCDVSIGGTLACNAAAFLRLER